MKRLGLTIAALTLSLGVAHAQSMNKTDKPNSPGATGAMQNSNANGVATDPDGVKEQQGRSVGASPGTVGAAPDTTSPSSNPAQKPK